MTDLAKLVRGRKSERQWLHLNGFENGDPNTNGEFSTVRFLKEHIGAFVDVGANQGDFVDLLIRERLKANLFCFEPNPQLRPLLAKKAFTGGKYVVHDCALADTVGSATFRIFKDTTASSLHDRSEMNPSFRKGHKSIQVSIKRLDDFKTDIARGLGKTKGLFIKIDTEGSEFPVLKGAEGLFGKASPTFLMFEYSFAWVEARQQFKDAFHYLDSHGFEVFRLLPIGLERVKFYRRDMDDTLYCNYVAVRNMDLGTLSPTTALETRYTTTYLVPF